MDHVVFFTKNTSNSLCEVERCCKKVLDVEKRMITATSQTVLRHGLFTIQMGHRKKLIFFEKKESRAYFDFRI